MQRRTAHSDLLERTLALLSSVTGRIAFLADLKKTGEYRHWGLERVYGQTETGSALSAAHTECMLDFLRMRFPEQVRDGAEEARRLNVRTEEVVQRLHAKRAHAAPKEWSGASQEHLEWSLFVLANWDSAEPRNGPAA